MLKLQKRQEEFLYKFTEEVIRIVKIKQAKFELEQQEALLTRKIVEAEKLKQKFLKYEQKPKIPKIDYEPKEIPEVNKDSKRTIELEVKKPSEDIKQVEEIKIEQKTKEQVIKKPQVNIQTKPDLPLIKLTIPLVQPQNELNLGKITFLLNDPSINQIECPGTDKNIIITKSKMRARTQITLQEEEILTIISDFSQQTRIPIVGGRLNARKGIFELSASIEGKNYIFIVKKIPETQNIVTPNPQFQTIHQQFPKIQQQAPRIQAPPKQNNLQMKKPF